MDSLIGFQLRCADFLVGQDGCRTSGNLSRSGQVVLGDLGALGQLLRTAVDGLADQHAFQTLEGIAFHDTQLVVQVQAVALQFVVDDLLGALVARGCLRG